MKITINSVGHYDPSMPASRISWSAPAARHGLAARGLRWLLCLWLSLLAWPALAMPVPGEGDVTLQTRFWIDATGQATADEVEANADRLEDMAHDRSFDLGTQAALWIQIRPAALDPGKRWYLLLTASAFNNEVSLHARDAHGAWVVQHSGDHLPVAQWDHPDQTPVFAVDPTLAGPLWLRIVNSPTPTSPRLQLLTEENLQTKRYTTFLFIGGYLGFGLLVLFLGWVHARLYGDRAFVAYCFYVACMLGFQASYTGIAGLFFWPQWAAWNDMAPAFFMLWLTGSGIWFVREACAVSRHHRGVDRFVVAWSLFGLLYPFVYAMLLSPATFKLLNLYGLLSVLLSISLCFWTWRKGETYAGWLLLGFLPVHLGYPFPALRSAGVLPDSWATQYAVLIGSAIEIPLLLYILHRRAKDFSENRTRLRAMESTDPLTGLTIMPVLRLRLRDALKRARRGKHQCGLLLVELSNHGEIAVREGREAGDRALVVAASRLASVVRDVDTVCRVSDTRFAVLIEGPVKPDLLKLVAQHVVAKGLERVPTLPNDLSLKFRLVSAAPPEADDEGGDAPDEQLLQRLHRALDRLGSKPRKVVMHLPGRQQAPA
ncbi:7TM diverse intracellular signaling domain-containing protein [Hydrogenophaga sp. RWCD_12]|uniref:sensor domain-containing diguanylate cyclase n=1 Tax=Hydrogenophaga sp. RWCD_12 TaxID=3391190 RepID=UPI0039849C8C